MTEEMYEFDVMKTTKNIFWVLMDGTDVVEFRVTCLPEQAKIGHLRYALKELDRCEYRKTKQLFYLDRELSIKSCLSHFDCSLEDSVLIQDPLGGSIDCPLTVIDKTVRKRVEEESEM